MNIIMMYNIATFMYSNIKCQISTMQNRDYFCTNLIFLDILWADTILMTYSNSKDEETVELPDFYSSRSCS